MAQVAYDLERFAPTPQRRVHTPNIRVAKHMQRQKKARWTQISRTMRILAGALTLVMLVCAVLYTQAAVTEVTTQIANVKYDLKEEKSLNTYLNFELENKTSLKNIEDAAAGMGLSKADSGQITYFRVEDGNGLQVKESLFAAAISNIESGLADIWDYLTI